MTLRYNFNPEFKLRVNGDKESKYTGELEDLSESRLI